MRDNNLPQTSHDENNTNNRYATVNGTDIVAQLSAQISYPTESIDWDQLNQRTNNDPTDKRADATETPHNQIPRPQQTAPSSRSSSPSSSSSNNNNDLSVHSSNNNKQKTPHNYHYITNYLSSQPPIIAAQWGDPNAQITNNTYPHMNALAGLIKQSTLDNYYAANLQQQQQQIIMLSANNDTATSTPITLIGAGANNAQYGDIFLNLTNDDFKSWVDAAFKWNITLLDDMMFLTVPNAHAPTGDNLANYDPNNPWPLILYGIDNIGGTNGNGTSNANPRPFYGDWANSFNQAYWPMHIPICMVICLVGIVVNFANIIVLSR